MSQHNSLEHCCTSASDRSNPLSRLRMVGFFMLVLLMGYPFSSTGFQFPNLLGAATIFP